MQQTEEPIRNLSRHQYGTLKLIAEARVTLDYMRNVSATTISSLAYRGYLRLSGTGGDAVVNLSATGEEALRVYSQATANMRQHEAELTERTLRLLKHSRRAAVHTLSKTA